MDGRRVEQRAEEGQPLGGGELRGIQHAGQRSHLQARALRLAQSARRAEHPTAVVSAHLVRVRARVRARTSVRARARVRARVRLGLS